jgi:sortase A
MGASTARSRALYVQYALFALGIACLGYVGYKVVEAHSFQREQAAAFTALVESAPAVREGSVSNSPSGLQTLALLEIPRLSISTPVVSGDGAGALDVAVGHLPDTALPWERGNSAFAAHRDGIFRPLRNIRVGDAIRVRTWHGTFTYQVRETRIVKPDDLTVLAPTRTPTLTLITCYPFRYVGHAPRRFIVHAELTSIPIS